ncbi:hypothetical protein C7S18_07920 [Ahniella affigens]|uniref:Histidine kinase/HSP90-like ATPase domain-containing protein n=1 Tax=Ahniella affigens TaxID=2021234 RepID=A0A2P1PQK2_9GAMM|nr:histidine kinase [Ahniella affigens]AVP97123.1 hypothetical protein C7S18_07920 [Ahniella affigens]
MLLNLAVLLVFAALILLLLHTNKSAAGSRLAPWILLSLATQSTILILGYQFINSRLLRPLSLLTREYPAKTEHAPDRAKANSHSDYLAQIRNVIDSAATSAHLVAQDKARLGSILNAASTFVLVCNDHGKMTYCNLGFAEMLRAHNLDPEQFHLDSLLTAEAIQTIRRAVSVEHGTIELATSMRLRQTAPMPVRLVAIPLDFGDDRLLLMATDLSEWVAMHSEMIMLEAERFRTKAALDQSEARARELEWGMLDIAEQEQRRIGRDLHDGLGQRLTGISFLAKVLVTKLEGDDPKHVPSAQWIVTLLNQAIDDVRQVSRELNPIGFEHHNLGLALRRLVNDVTESCGVSCELIDRCSDLHFSGAVAAQIFRIVQEAINNALRHGRANIISVFLERRSARLRICILDDGIGFDVSLLRTGSGLVNMRTRTAALSGSLRCRSKPHTDRGTILIVSIPEPIVDLWT